MLPTARVIVWILTVVMPRSSSSPSRWRWHIRVPLRAPSVHIRQIPIWCGVRSQAVTFGSHEGRDNALVGEVMKEMVYGGREMVEVAESIIYVLRERLLPVFVLLRQPYSTNASPAAIAPRPKGRGRLTWFRG